MGWNWYIYQNWGLTPIIHKAGLPLFDSASEQADMMEFPYREGPKPEQYVAGNEFLYLDEDKIEVRYTPGHADGSICLIMHNEKSLIAGDVLFAGGVGRANLPTGNMDLLLNSINEQLLTLEDDYKVFPGHGPGTTIGEGKAYNPFL